MHPILLQLLEDLGAVIVEDDEKVIPPDSEYEGWFCVNIRPAICAGCGRAVCYVEPNEYHFIIVWEEKDDKDMLTICQRLQGIGFEPRVDTYHPYLGACVPWEMVIGE